MEGEVLKIPPVSGVNVIDATGACNASSAAVLYGVCEGFAPFECGIMGSISAAFCIGQFGPPRLDDRAREATLNMRGSILSNTERKEGYAKN